MRKQAMARRAAIHRARGQEVARAVHRHFTTALSDGLPLASGDTVSAYWPMGNEFDVRPLLGALDEMGCVCALPVVGPRTEPLKFRRWRRGDVLVPAGFGTHEPAEHAAPVTPMLLLVPLLAFDDAGFRLGYGAGYYDRTLHALRAAGEVCAVGVAFEAQRVDAVPREAHDQPLDWVVTEAGARRPSARQHTDEGR